ncbi:MAG TPA: hypothetical protein VFA76_04360 [Terriglobales bacterium]|nr:hypothetical protein [Terriglobales bacterium]
MRIRVFSHDSNPAVDPPLCHKSEAYVLDLLKKLRAFRIDDRSVQLYPPDEHSGWVPRVINRPRHWQPIRGVLQFVEGDIEGRKGKFSYPIPACGARTRPVNVWEINGRPRPA